MYVIIVFVELSNKINMSVLTKKIIELALENSTIVIVDYHVSKSNFLLKYEIVKTESITFRLCLIERGSQ